ncbi:PilZ domain-containing protein, partial [Klebsiella pneumoniae]|nr:PilZ domain-containing protein [Klebsiella pneumoniae]
GFMVDNAASLNRGDRIIIRLPIVGRIEAYVIWARDTRAGFQFERIIRLDDFDAIIDELQPNPRLRRSR